MTALQRKAIAMIPDIPDDKLYFVVQILEGVRGLEPEREAEKRDRAFAALERLRRPAPELDYREELASWREERYETKNPD